MFGLMVWPRILIQLHATRKQFSLDTVQFIYGFWQVIRHLRDFLRWRFPQSPLIEVLDLFVLIAAWCISSSGKWLPLSLSIVFRIAFSSFVRKQSKSWVLTTPACFTEDGQWGCCRLQKESRLFLLFSDSYFLRNGPSDNNQMDSMLAMTIIHRSNYLCFCLCPWRPLTEPSLYMIHTCPKNLCDNGPKQKD